MEEIPGPSGSILPLFLRRKSRDSTNEADRVASTGGFLNPKQETEHKSNKIFTADEIASRIKHISSGVLVDIQKQIYRGEESYYEETYSHGNLFRGWDAFVDSKEIGTASSAAPPQGPTRKVPGDSRWFSGSNRGVARNFRQGGANRGSPAGRANSGPGTASSRKSSSVNLETSGRPDTKTSGSTHVATRAVPSVPTHTPVQSRPPYTPTANSTGPSNQSPSVGEAGNKRKAPAGDAREGEIMEPSTKKTHTEEVKASTSAPLKKDVEMQGQTPEGESVDTSKPNEVEGNDLVTEESQTPTRKSVEKQGDQEGSPEEHEVTSPKETQESSESEKAGEPAKRRSSRNRRSS